MDLTDQLLAEVAHLPTDAAGWDELEERATAIRLTPANALLWRDNRYDLLDRYPQKMAEEAVCPPFTDPGRARLLIASLHTVFLRADLVIWKLPLLFAALQGSEAFEETKPGPEFFMDWPALWVFEEPIMWGNNEVVGLPPDAHLEAVAMLPVTGMNGAGGTLIRTGRRGTSICLLYSGSTLLPTWRFLPALFREPPPPDTEDAVWEKGTLHGCYCHFAALARFLTLEFVALQKEQLPRHLRRQAELRRRPPLPEVKTVVLRRAVRKPGEPGESEAREWSCQWIVGAHWRKQWMPKTQTHEPRYIQPYVKGPSDKPLRQPKGPVYVVSR